MRTIKKKIKKNRSYKRYGGMQPALNNPVKIHQAPTTHEECIQQLIKCRDELRLTKIELGASLETSDGWRIYANKMDRDNQYLRNVNDALRNAIAKNNATSQTNYTPP